MKVTKTKWNKIWTQELSKPGLFILNNAEAIAVKMIKEVLSLNSKIIDVGCGTGRTLSLISKSFPNAIGIDYSKTSIRKCKNMGLKVLEMDARNILFPDKQFDLVFEEGLLEHYNNMSQVVKEMCRVSKSYVLAVQPKATRFIIFLKNLYWRTFKRKYADEIPYTLEDYCNEFKKFGFELIKEKSDAFNFLYILLFKRIG